MKEQTQSCESYQEWSRRSLLKSAMTGAAALVFGPSALAQISLKKRESDQDTLIVVFLRGGADGLNMVVPYGEDEYYKLRPSIALQKPRSGLRSDRVLDLDGFFGLHPAMASLKPLYGDGKLAMIHAIGSGDGSHSHFEAMSAMERGLNASGPGSSKSDGWIARYLNATASDADSPMRALALGDVMPDSLLGYPGALNFADMSQYRLEGSKEFHREIAKAYSKGSDPMTYAGRETIKLLETLEKLDYKGYQPNNASYPDTALGQGMRQVAFLVKAGAGLEVAMLDHGGFDTHVVQGGSTGWLANLLSDLAKSIRALTDDLGSHMKKTTILLMTEFGRRAYENGGLGTDHGSASVMLTIGAGVNGGKVYGDWPTLSSSDLIGPGDLRVTTDYRTVLSEVLQKRMGLGDTKSVFPGINDSLGVFKNQTT